MTNRRTFIRNGASLATLVALPVHLALGAPHRSQLGDASLALADGTLETSAAFAAAAHAAGVPVHRFSRDVAALWMSAIEPALSAGAVTIAGHTSAATLFCLDLLARDYGARVVRRVDEGSAVTWIISSNPGRRAPLAPAAVRASRSAAHA